MLPRSGEDFRNNPVVCRPQVGWSSSSDHHRYCMEIINRRLPGAVPRSIPTASPTWSERELQPTEAHRLPRTRLQRREGTDMESPSSNSRQTADCREFLVILATFSGVPARRLQNYSCRGSKQSCQKPRSKREIASIDFVRVRPRRPHRIAAAAEGTGLSL
jgi:hypothetical protein